MQNNQTDITCDDGTCKECRGWLVGVGLTLGLFWFLAEINDSPVSSDNRSTKSNNDDEDLTIISLTKTGG